MRIEADPLRTKRLPTSFQASLNAIVAGDSIVMSDGCPKVREQLESLGFTVFETPLSEFHKAGGSLAGTTSASQAPS